MQSFHAYTVTYPETSVRYYLLVALGKYQNIVTTSKSAITGTCGESAPVESLNQNINQYTSVPFRSVLEVKSLNCFFVKLFVFLTFRRHIETLETLEKDLLSAKHDKEWHKISYSVPNPFFVA